MMAANKRTNVWTHRLVTALSFVTNWSPSGPWMWRSPSSESFQPPKE